LTTSGIPGGSYYWTVNAVRVVPAANAINLTTITTPFASPSYFVFCKFLSFLIQKTPTNTRTNKIKIKE